MDAPGRLWHHWVVKSLLPVVFVLTLLLPGGGEAQMYRATAPSDITVEVRPDGLVVQQRSVRYEVYDAIPDDIKVGVAFEHRLATISTVSDGATDDQTSRIEVTVDALSGDGLRRITAFSDAGSEGAVSGPYFMTIQRGCCSPLTRHHVRNVETGRLLFTATGAGIAGLVALMTVPNHHPTIERWAAFEGRPDGANNDRSMLGFLRYGDRSGALDTVILRMDVAKQPEEFILDLPSCGALLWLEPGWEPAQGQPRRPDGEKCFAPPGLSYSTPLFGLEHSGKALGGFELEMSLSGMVYATISVRNDRLDLAHARLAPGVSLVQVQPTP